MAIQVFRIKKCAACGRPAQELSSCPWCGAGVGPDKGTVLRLLALSMGVVLLLIPSCPDNVHALLAAVIVSSVLLAVSATNPKAVLQMALAAVAVSGLCHACPDAMSALAVKLRLHAVWLIPAAALIAVSGVAMILPPVPAASTTGRSMQVLKTPLAIVAVAALATAAALAPAGPPSLAAMALCCATALSALRPRAAVHALCAILFAFAFLLPASDFTTLGMTSVTFAVTFCACGLVQAFMAMKRSRSESSSQP